jgi:hypothetical protein
LRKELSINEIKLMSGKISASTLIKLSTHLSNGLNLNCK